MKKYHKGWRKKNPTNIKSYYENHYLKNRSKILALSKKRRLDNPQYFKEYRRLNKKRINESRKKWIIENVDKVRGYKRKYAKILSKEYLNEKSKRWATKNPDKVRLRTKLYRKANPEKIRVNNRNRRALKKNAKGSFTESEWENRKKEYDYKCAICKEVKFLTTDHIIPLSKKGTNYISNIQPLCQSCNSRKGNKIY